MKKVLMIMVFITLKMPKIKFKFLISVDPVEAAHNELPHLDLYCMTSGP